MNIEVKKKIKEKLFSFYSQRILKKDKQRISNVGFNKAISIGILYKYHNLKSQKAITYFTKELKKTGKKVDAICFIEDLQKDFDYKFPSFGYEDITIRGNIIDEQIRLFLNKDFDYLYFTEFDVCPILSYILSKSIAKCKVGYYNNNISNYLDLMVNFKRTNTDKDLLNLINEMLKYSSSI